MPKIAAMVTTQIGQSSRHRFALLFLCPWLGIFRLVHVPFLWLLKNFFSLGSVVDPVTIAVHPRMKHCWIVVANSMKHHICRRTPPCKNSSCSMSGSTTELYSFSLPAGELVRQCDDLKASVLLSFAVWSEDCLTDWWPRVAVLVDVLACTGDARVDW